MMVNTAPDSCTLGAECDETGICYAAAHEQPERCGRRHMETTMTSPEDELAALKATVKRLEADAAKSAERLADAVLQERCRIADALDEEADLTSSDEDAMITRTNAMLVRANFSYEEADRLAAMKGGRPKQGQ